VKTKYLIFTVSIIILGCTAQRPEYTGVSEIDPLRLVAKQDSLLAADPENKELVEALVSAHLVLAHHLTARGNKEAARHEYLSVLELDENNADANYYLSMARGHESFQKGRRTELWDAIEEFSRAARYAPARGEPHYWVGRAYEKKDDDDFELIVESYERAFILELTEELRKDCEL
jgi:tetratricopeptide (TPR) repeat protein